MLRRLLLSSALATIASGALAADLPSRKEAAPFAASMTNLSWDGWYAGANAGYGFGSNSVTYAPFNSFLPSVSPSRKGVLGGLQLGYNKQLGNWVVGVETDFDFGQVRGTANTTSPVILPAFVALTQRNSLQSLGSTRLRAGLLVMPQTLVYATGGLAYGRSTTSTDAVVVNNGACNLGVNFCVSGSSQKWKAGWTVGGGLEQYLSSNWSAKVEYAYYDLGKQSAVITLANGNAGTWLTSSAIKGSIVKVGLNYHFGMPASAVIAKY